MRSVQVAALMLMLCLDAGVSARPPQGTASPRFEVVSIRPNKTADGSNRLSLQPGGRFIATNVALELLIRRAYQVEPFQLTGGPEWLKSDRFDIVATSSADLAEPTPWNPGPVPSMLQSVLADRFKLVVRREQREMPIYAMVLARADGRLGPGLQRSKVDCQALAAAARLKGGAPLPPPSSSGRPVCGMRTNSGRILGGGVPLSQLAAALGGLGRGVFDRTGLSGAFDFEVTYTPTQAGAPSSAGAAADAGASIFTALQEQLGLKLEAQRGPVDVVVVERAQRPDPD